VQYAELQWIETLLERSDVSATLAELTTIELPLFCQRAALRFASNPSKLMYCLKLILLNMTFIAEL
jgi:hypothetical protein